MALNKETKKTLVNQHAHHAGDTGSMEVQVALLTEDIRVLTDHARTHKRDFSSKRGLLMKVARRKRYLTYLERKDRSSYQQLIKSLGLKR